LVKKTARHPGYCVDMCVSFSVTKLVKSIHSLHIGALYTITTILYKEKSTKITDFQLFKGKK
jgi:hypothetical protein